MSKKGRISSTNIGALGGLAPGPQGRYGARNYRVTAHSKPQETAANAQQTAIGGRPEQERLKRTSARRSGVFRASKATHRRALSPRQLHILGVLRRVDENWLEMWELAKRCGYTSKVAAANVRELRRRGLVVTRPIWYSLSTVEVGLNPTGARRNA